MEVLLIDPNGKQKKMFDAQNYYSYNTDFRNIVLPLSLSLN